ncbi:hypothetical protein [Azospirillum sp. B506]|uniref:hypothetical protein n=1 Tax=Azospirillum sp. B506 TaxID=137721 RepID=UPI001FCBD0DA|nr:hypothetical protein [Azospirillum sp. B506]
MDRYGGDLALWPDDAARDARRLLLRSVKAQAMLDAMVTMELALGQSAPDRLEDSPSPDLADRIFAAAFRLGPSSRGFDEDGDQPPRLM